MKHTLLYVFLFITLLFLIAVPCSAANETFSGGYTDTFVDIDSLTQMLSTPIDTFSGIFDFTGDNIWNVRRKFNDTYIVSVNPGTGKKGYVSYNFEAIPIMLNYDTLAFGIQISTSNEENGIPAEPYRVVMDIHSGTGVTQSYVSVMPNVWTLVHFNIDFLSGIEDFKKLSIRIEYVGKEVPDNVEMTCLHGDITAPFRDIYSAYSISMTQGNLYLNNGVLHVLPDSTGRVTLSFDYLQHALPENTAGFMLAVTLQGNHTVGSVSAGVRYRESDTILTTSSVQLSEELETYLFPLPSPETDGAFTTNDFDIYYLYFYDLETTDTDKLILASTQIYFVPPEEEPEILLPEVENLGTILSFGITGDEIVFSGKLSRSAVIRYIDDTIELYAVPVWDRLSMKNAVRLGECKVTNSYTITLPLSSYRTYAENWMFFLALSHKDSDNPEDNTLYLLNQPQFLSGHAPAASSLSILGLQDANAVGVFESNVSHVVVDISLNQLLTPNGNTVCSRNGKSWHLDTSLLAALDSEIQFYADAGLEVCLRISADTPIEGLTYMSAGAESYLPYLTTEGSIEQYTAIIAYLSRRYPTMDSIMLGSGINSEKYTGIPTDDPVYTVKYFADLAALTYSAAAAYIHDIYIIVPFTDDYDYANAITEKNIDYLAPEFISMLFADYLNSLGNIPWVFGYNFHFVTEDTFALPDAISRNLQQMGFTAPADTVFMWIPNSLLYTSLETSTLVENYATMCKDISVVKPRALILSLQNIIQKADPQMYSAMKDIQVENSSRIIWDHPADIAEQGTSALLSSLTLYDFSTSYSAMGWVAGGGITEIYTRYNPLFSDGTHIRTLRSLLPLSQEDNGTHGIAGGVLLKNFTRTLDLSSVDEITFRFSLSDQTEQKILPDSGATVIFLLGSQDHRAEYYAYTVPYGEVIDARCDLSEYENANQISYVGVMVYANETVILDLSNVTFSSNELSQDELTALFYGTEEEADSMTNFTEIFYILIISMILTICAALLLLRRDREELDAVRKQG